MLKITIFAEFALVAANTRAFAADTVAMTVAIGHLTFIVSHRTFFALPAGIALALAVDVVATLRAQHGANT